MSGPETSLPEIPLPEIPWSALAAPLVAAEDALARLDERLRTGSVSEGWVARSHFGDACASLWVEGELVTLEDLALHDAGMDIRAPTPQLIRARAVVDARRLVAAQAPGRALSPEGLARLCGGETPAAASPAPAAVADSANDSLDAALALVDAALARSAKVLAEAAPAAAADGDTAGHLACVAAWRRFAGALDHLPPVLAAGLLWDAWETAPPVRQGAWLGRLLAADYLRARGKASAHLPCVNAGLRLTPWEQRRSRDGTVRLAAWCEAMRAGAAAGLREYDRIALAVAMLERKLARRRATSRLPALISLAACRPLLTAGIVARTLGVSARAAQTLIAELGLRETTGRGRYRAWML